MMKKATLVLIALAVLLPSRLSAQPAPTVRELVPSSAPAGARVLVTGRGLADPNIAVAFGALSASVLQRNDRFIEVVVPSAAVTGNVRITLGATLIKELSFNVATQPRYIVSTLAGGKQTTNDVFKHPNGAAVILPDGTVAVADEQHDQIKLVTPAGVVSVLAGSGSNGSRDGRGTAAEFKDPRNLTFDVARRVLYVSDTGNHTIRRVALDGTVTTLAGSGKSGYQDGLGVAAEFNAPEGITVASDGAIYIADTKNNRIRKLLVDGTVTTTAATATFSQPRGIVADGTTLYVADTKNNAIRKIADGQTTTVISFPRTGDGDDPDDGVDGNASVLNRPSGIGVDEAGDLIVSDSENDFIRKIRMSVTPATMITIAGTGKNGQVDGDGAIAQFKDPIGLAVAGAIYVADEDNDAIRRLCPEVRVSGFFSLSGAITAGSEVRVLGTGFVPGGTIVKFGSVIATDVTWISASELSVKLPQAPTGGTVSITISACGGTTVPTTFVIDSAAPMLTITNGGVPLSSGSLFKVPVTPVIVAVDDVDPAPRITAMLNNFPFLSGSTITADGIYTLEASAEDAAGNHAATQTVGFTIDVTPPIVEVLEGTTPFAAGTTFNRAIAIDAKITDLTPTTNQPLIDGAPYDLRQPYATNGTHSFTIKVVDALGNERTVGPLVFTIDTSAPGIAITSHTEGQVVTSRDVTITGESEDAVTVQVNGVNATIDAATKTFTIALTLHEGENAIAARGIDAAGNQSDPVIRKIVLDSRAPEVTIESLASCEKNVSVDLRGTVSDPHIDKIVVKLGDVSTNATIDGSNWTATIGLGLEGRKTILVEASDTVGHIATEQVTITVDRTAPAIEISESGAPFTASIVGRKVTLFTRASDVDTHVIVTTTLDGAAWTSGDEIGAEGSHTLRVTAKDCAGNESAREHTFSIDLTAPRFLTFTPASGSKVTQVPSSLSGTVDNDAREVRIIEWNVIAPVTNGTFTIANVGFADGVNDLTLEVIDAAGHIGQTSYTLGVKTSKPLVEIVEGGEAMVDGAVYTRAVAPQVRLFEQNVTATATLDGAPFTSGNEVTANGAHTITATATDSAFGQSNTITRHFTIDRTGPQVTIVAPVNGAVLDADRVEVRVTAGDAGSVSVDNAATSVSVNGIAATKQDATWLANVLLDLGENTILAVARDAAGNSGSAAIEVTRGVGGPAIVLTFPPDLYVTNRPQIDVVGRALRQGATVTVTVPPAQAANIATDPAGTFRLAGAALTEGEWTIVATATDVGKSTSVQARVIADFTPPVVRILESGSALEDGAGYATQAVISGEATDRNTSIDSVLTIDGEVVASPATIIANGGHTAIVTARDAAGNESRLERTFYIGSSAGSGCRLEAFDPPDQSIVTSQKVELIGRSGGAAGVKVNGVAAKMSNGSFCASVELPQEGANSVTIACTTADGTPIGDPVTITLNRVTNEPSVTITAPIEDFVTFDDTLTVTGTLGNSAISVDVNGKPAIVNGSNWTVSEVRLTDGLNVLVARARNVGGRIAIASRRVTLIQDPPAISISSPVPGFISGTSTTDVSGTFANVDPTSLAVQGFAGAVQPTLWSDTTGKFIAQNVPLQSGACTEQSECDNTIVITGRDRTGRTARAEVLVRYLSTVPTINITSPADNDYFGASQGATLRVSGSFNAVEGSSVDVNGVTATVDQVAKTFAADVPFSTLPGGMTPVVARLAQPEGGDGAFDSIRVFKLSDAPTVIETFPAPGAIEVDPGVVVLALFSAPMERQSTLDAFRLENSSSTAINGKAILDKDVLTFAPATTLTASERYTFKVATSAKDLAGQPLAQVVSNSFVIATSAPSQAPTITTASGRICAQLIDVNGTTIAGARVRLDYGQLSFTTTASATGAFTYKIPLSGQAGYHVIRVRTVGADGTLSAAAELKLNLDCAGPHVLRASFDRNVNQLTIVFSTDVKATSLTTGATGSVQLVLSDQRVVAGTINVSGANVGVVPSEDLAQSTFTLKVTRDVEDLQGRKLELLHTQLFAFGDDEDLPPGYGYISGEVYDATTGRPLAGAEITIEAPTAAFARRPILNTQSTTRNPTTQAITITTSARGRYAQAFPEGAHTIRASADGYTTVWRQIVLPAGAGVIPIDIRLTHRGETKTIESGALSHVHGGNNAVTRRAELIIPAGAATSGASVTLTSTGAQSLAGLLPLGWSPLASAEIVSTALSLAASTLTFNVPEIPAGQSLTAVRYDESRDEWRVITAIVNVANGKASLDVTTPGAYALVYGDRRPGLASPPSSSVGAPLVGVTDPCADGTCPAMVAKGFPLDPEVVLPTGSTVATLKIDGASPHVFPSGTAVQAYIDEELHLADGGRELDPPFATDLLLYRDLAGNDGEAIFNLAPSPRAAEVFLEVGFDHIRILPYPGRLDRGTLIGPEGGRVPGDEKVAIEIPTGATQDALNASASSLADPNSLGPIAGYTIVGGFQLTLDRASQPTPTDIDGDGDVDPITGVELSRPARATFSILNSQFPILNSVILVEVLDGTPYGQLFRLAAEMTPVDGGRWMTKTIDRNLLPIDGVIREGRYLLLAANAPIAFARGVVRVGAGVATRDARITTPGLGVTDLSRVSGIFSIPVPATPAAPFSLVPRIVAAGDGATYTHASAPAANTVVNVGDLLIVAQPPQVASTTPTNNATNVSLTTSVEAMFTPGIDPFSITTNSLTVTDTTDGSVVPGTAAANGILGIRWTLPPGETLQAGRRYVAAIAATVRGTNGSPLGQTYTFAFTTTASVTSDEVHPERIRITIPDANGVSKIIGTAGALKSGWLAVPVRRGKDFLTRYSAEAVTDGSFSVIIGTNERDRVSISDTIDLRVLNNNGALVAIIPLTPFAAEDGKAFIAPAHTAVSFTSTDGITIDVPAGAFDTATRIDLTTASPAAFNGIPQLAQELVFAGTVDVKFEGRAKVPLQLTIPITAGTDLTREFFLAVVGASMRGPRLMAIDTLTVADGKLTTRTSQSNARGLRTNSGGNGAKDILQKFIEAGQFAAAMMHPDQGTLAWSFINTGATVNELHWDTLSSMYVGSTYIAEADGVVAFPVPANTKFVLTAIDPATSLTAFEETYNGIPIGAPGTGTPIANPDTDFNGPHPVFATPFRIETATAPVAGVTLKAIRDLEIELSETGVLSVTRLASLSADTKVSVLDVESGERRGPQVLPITMNGVKAGHRLIISIDEKDVDPSSTVSVVFNEPINVGAATKDDEIDAFLRGVLRFERAAASGAAGVDLLNNALLRLDSSGRRVTILLPSLLEAGARFRLTLDSNIADRSGNNLKLAQAARKNPDTGAITPIGPSPAPIELWFKTRGPNGTFAEFDIRQTDAAQFGAVREIAQYDNLLFVAALDGGVLAYDVSDPQALVNDTTPGASNPKPISIAPGRDSATTNAVTDYWTVHVDHHGRVFSTGMANMFGALRTWRVEDFIKAKTSTVAGCLPTMKNTVCTQTGGAITSQNPGTAYGVGLASAFVSEDRVEAIPRKAKFVIGDALPVPYDWATFVSGFCNGTATNAGDGIHQKCNAKIPGSGSNYRIQRITIENVTLGLRWSEDAIDNEPAQMMNVIAAPGDEMRVTHNLTTYAVISLFGWGIGVFDVNGIESNDVPGTSPSGIVRAKEQVALRAYAESPAMPKDIQYVGDLAYSPESHILESNANTVKVYLLDTRKGVVEFAVTPPDTIDYTGKLVLTGGAHPRFEALKTALVDAGNASPLARFNTAALYRNPDTGKDYLVIAALDYGLVVVEVGAMPITAESFADAVKIPDGATAVRVIDKTNIAAVVDGTGRVLLVDLARVDERDRVSSPHELFPTVANAIREGTQDPRILWRSEEPIAIGNVAPVIDPDTGMLIGADMLGRRVRLASVIDPKLRITVNLGDANNKLKEVGSIVPLGIEPPSGIVKCDVAADANCRGSLAVFRIEARLPGSLTESLATESLAGQLAVALESEAVLGADTAQTPQPYPVAHLRQTKRDGNVDARATNDFALKRVLDFAASATPELRYQKGWNRFASDWIVAIADPRAAKDYGAPPADCPGCKRPAYLASLANVREIYTTGRFLSIRPELATAGPYGFLAQNDRFHKRISTTPADTVRPTSALVAAQAPPIAGGMLQETTYLHSGELETSTIDLDSGGRAGWNVIIDRTYRSRTIGLSPLAQGWDSSMFRRLRALPNGNVEYRDGAEIWTFKSSGNEYLSPAGLALKLVKRDGGWNLIDQKFRIASFDDLGRLVSESDEFYSPSDPGSGNVIHYTYDEQGRLAAIVDPASRVSNLAYDGTGLLRQVRDWRNATREIEYARDQQGRLTSVKLPVVTNTSGSRPEILYGYSDAGSSYKEQLELRANLRSIVDPGATVARVELEYEPADRVKSQKWGTGESASMSYPSATSARVTDILGQERIYTLTENNGNDALADRAHVTELRETVPVWDGAAFGQLPGSVSAGVPATSNRDRVWTFTYAEGMQTGVELDGVSKTTVGYTSAPGVAGKLVSSTTSGPATSSLSSGISAQSTPWMPADATIARTFEYQTGQNAAAFIKATTAGSKRIESPEPHRNNVAPLASNDSISATSQYDKNGLFRESASSGGTDTGGAGSRSKIDYFTDAAPKHARSQPQFIREGKDAAELTTKIEYPSETQTIETDPRGVVTTTDFDNWQRPVKVSVTKPNEPLALETRYEYDAAGRIDKIIQKQDGNDVTTTHSYDVMGRRTATTTNNIATVGSVTTSTAYDLANRKTITTQPGGAITTTEVDTLGRAIASMVNTGSSPIEQRFAYDLAGNRVYSTDLFVASATAYDSHGRAIATRAADGTITTVKHDETGQPIEVKALDPSATETVAQSSYTFSAAGRLESMKAKVDAATDRSTTMVWDGGGRTTGAATSDRASRSSYDLAGRPLMHAAGAGSASALSEIFSKSEITAYAGDLPATTESSERSGPAITTSVERDTAGGVRQANTGSLEWKQKYDELGNVTEASAPGRPAAKWDVDARGAVKEETLPDGAKNQYAYNGSGAQTNYNDPTSEATSTITDMIGRPTSRTYADGTTETITWEGSRLKSIVDRQGREQSYAYNAKGQLEEIRSGSEVLDRIAYDTAGRMVSWKTPDSELTWGEFDMEGRPKSTIQRRFKNGTGLTTGQLLDEFEQQHSYNEHGERTFASMPIYAGLTLSAGWTEGIAEQHDAMGNVISIARANAPGASGAIVMSATYRNAGRPDSRTVMTAGGDSFVRTYSYDADTARLTSLSVANANGVIAGSEVSYDGLQLGSAKLLGVSSGERYQHWSYDDRSRVAASLYGVKGADANPDASAPGRSEENLSLADFRNAQVREPALDNTTRTILAQKNIDTTKIDPPTSSFTEQSGHKIAEMVKGPQVRPFAYQGAERIDDGRFTYEFDVKGRLIRATEKSTVGPVRSIAYKYSGTGRLVGRRAEYSTSATSPIWQIEDRSQILAADGHPADATFVWDPITDRLVSIFKSGATATTDANGGLLKQIIHGDASYDDPLETTTIDPATGAVTHLYPIYDEAGSGSLQAILNTNGEVIARNLSRDPYGAEDVALTGAAVDNVKVDVKKTLDIIDTVTVTLHTTEELAESTIATGARLATVDKNGALVRITTVTPTRVGADTHTPTDDDHFALRWTLTAAEWTTLTNPTPITIGSESRTPTDLSIAATANLRATNWSSDLPLLPAPTWVQASRPVFSSDTLPAEIRDPLNTLAVLVDSVSPDATATSNLYEIDSLTLLGNPSSADNLSEDIVSARMHAHPFSEPMTRLNYVRNRWYDPGTGTFLSPDPMGYADSSNLYSFAGGDPVNHRDPTGNFTGFEEFVAVLLSGSSAGTAIAGSTTAAAGATGAAIGSGGLGLAIGGAIITPFAIKALGEEDAAYEAEARLQQTISMNAARTRKKLQRPRAPEVSPYSQQADTVDVSVQADPLLQQHNEEAEKRRKKRNEHLAGSKHPCTQVPFDENANPTFESISEVELPAEMIPMKDDAQFRYATRQLRKQLKEHPELVSSFTPQQFSDIETGQPRVGGWTWHHKTPTLLQLVDRTIHAKTGHTGGRAEGGGRRPRC